MRASQRDVHPRFMIDTLACVEPPETMVIQNMTPTRDDRFFALRGYFVFLAIPFLFAAASVSGRPIVTHAHWVVDGVDLACLAISLVGLAIRVWTVGQVIPGTSSRRRGGPRASDLNTSGPYSLVRHPLYVGNLLIGLGVASLPRVWWLAIGYVVAYAIVIGRVVAAEERVLSRSFGPAYEAWARKTFAFLPSFTHWSGSERSFSIRMVLRREYGTWLATFAAFLVAELAIEATRAHGGPPGSLWVVLGAIGLVQFVVLRHLKKRTNLLRVDRRRDAGGALRRTESVVVDERTRGCGVASGSPSARAPR